MSIVASPSPHPGIGVPRTLAIAEAWSGLAGVEPFTGRTGSPLARTVKLVLDPLILRPAQNPQLAPALLSLEAAARLRAAISAAGHDLAAAASWFLLLKRERRRAGITEGNPQELYFQRAYELARLHGTPEADADGVAAHTLAGIHDGTRLAFAELRAHLSDPRVGREVRRAVEQVWVAAKCPAPAVPRDRVIRFLEVCAQEHGAAEEFMTLVKAGAGSASAVPLMRKGTARHLGLTDLDLPEAPEPGVSASKSTLPLPFDRSILERLFASYTAIADSGIEVEDLVAAEIQRSAGGWQLAEESHRVLLLAASLATSLLASEDDAEAAWAERTDAGERLLARWHREPFVRRALRLGEPASETKHVRKAIMRRLWARLHGRELRAEPVLANEAWQLIDGAMRSVILDRRSRVKAAIARDLLEATA
ncbi:hypothetical protein [Paenarthrobacter sp.]|uniref:hypothetical protein n=1 Tax=Paenarthrobacter sp. TaxID=1931993 RepID=UPI0028117E9F|nr:hypothetical protein [Paenarthrobacter sp.]